MKQHTIAHLWDIAHAMLREGEIPCIPECLQMFDHSATATYKLITETFGDMLCEGAKLLAWLFSLQEPISLGRHASKYSVWLPAPAALTPQEKRRRKRRGQDVPDATSFVEPPKRRRRLKKAPD